MTFRKRTARGKTLLEVRHGRMQDGNIFFVIIRGDYDGHYQGISRALASNKQKRAFFDSDIVSPGSTVTRRDWYPTTLARSLVIRYSV